MLYGYYECDIYDYTGSNKEDTVRFLEGMEFKTFNIEGEEYEFAVLPLSIQASDFPHRIGGFSFEGEYYYAYTEEGRAMFRKALMAEEGDMTEEQFAAIEMVMNMDVVECYLVDRYGGIRVWTFRYTIENGKLCLYYLYIDNEYNVTMGEEPLIRIDFLHEGGNVILRAKGVERNYVSYEADDYIYTTGYAKNANNKYKNLDGMMFSQNGADGEATAYVTLEGGASPVDEVVTYDRTTCDFTLSWTETIIEYNGRHERVPDPVTITGKLIPCNEYGGGHDLGFFLLVDGQLYRYTMSEAEYEDIMYGDIEEASGGSLDDEEKVEIAVTKTNILTDMAAAFEAAGIQAQIDESTGKITLESSILFATNSADLSPEGKAYLEGFIDAYSAVLLSDAYSGYVSSIIIEGHTDTAGSYSSNLTLSENRAASVASLCLQRNPAMATMIQTKGYSYDYPVYNEDGSVNMAASRRVTFRFILSVG